MFGIFKKSKKCSMSQTKLDNYNKELSQIVDSLEAKSDFIEQMFGIFKKSTTCSMSQIELNNYTKELYQIVDSLKTESDFIEQLTELEQWIEQDLLELDEEAE